MEILTKELFTAGCQFQSIEAHEKWPLYITEYNSQGTFILLIYKYACEYGKDSWENISRVVFTDPEYFVFQYNILGELENILRYYKNFKIVSFQKHLF